MGTRTEGNQTGEILSSDCIAVRRKLSVVRRPRAALGLILVVLVGLASRRFPIGIRLWDKSAGDALYAVMIYFAVACARPLLAPRQLGAIALAASLAIEAFQLTGIPARLPRVLQIALGTTFAWHDVACYVVGAFAVTLADSVQRVIYRKGK